MPDSKEFILGKQILHEDDLKFKVTYKDDVFVLRYPTLLIKAQIESEIARRLGGMPRESFAADTLAQIEMTAYVNAMLVVEECPRWFQDGVKSLWEYYDEMLAVELYRGYVDFRDRFRDDLSKDRYEVGRAGTVS